LLNVIQNGFSDTLTASQPQGLTIKSLEKRISGLIDELEPQLGEPQLDVDFMSPGDWKAAHANLYSREELNDREFQELFVTVANFGVPQRNGQPDLETVRSQAGLSFVSIVAISDAVGEILRFAESGDLDPEVLQRLGVYGGQQWQRKLHNFVRDIEHIRSFAASWSGIDDDDEALSKVRRFEAVDWWEPRHDLALIFAMSEFGQLVVTSWVVDASRPFREFVPVELLEDFEKAADKEKETRRVCKPKELGGLGFLFKDKIRMSRALAVVQFMEHMRDRRASTPTLAPSLSLPFQLSPQITLLSFGRFASRESQFAVGYTVRVSYLSPVHPPDQVLYEATVGFDEKFRVRMLSEPYLTFVGDGVNGPWDQIFALADATAEAAGIPFTAFRPNGVALLGLNHPVVVDQLAKMKRTAISSLPIPLLSVQRSPPRVAQYVINPSPVPRVEVPVAVSCAPHDIDSFGIGALMNDHSHQRRPMTTVYSRKVNTRPVGDEY
jgi:chromodomain-helicase-DNA-binding protein 7